MLLVFVLSLCFNFVNSYKILGLFPYPIKSHFAVFDSLMMELANRGHNVTVYDTFPKQYTISNYRQVDIKPCFILHDIPTIENMISDGFAAIDKLKQFLPSYEELSICRPLLDLWNSTERYDVIITEVFATDIFFLYGDRLKIPIIGFHSNAPFPWHCDFVGLPNNPSYVPVGYARYPPKMNFYQRTENFLINLYSLVRYRREFQTSANEVARKVFGQVPPIEDVIKNISLLFLYTHFTYGTIQPIPPNVVLVGGLHIKKNLSLPENIEKFINESEHGVIYFCMGSFLKSVTFPEEKRNAFLNAFSKIPQRVLWKWEGKVLPGKSDNIMISKWMPQRDILAHPNVKIFISHGGLLSTSEAVYESVPVLGIPILSDQQTNMKFLEAHNAGELLNYNEISEDVVLDKITKLTTDPKYKENMKILSERYKDRPMSALDTAVYWTEYVIRHKGAPHLRPVAADMPAYQYLLLDVIAFLILACVSVLVIMYYSLKITLICIYHLISDAKSSSKTNEKKKVN